MGVQGVVWGAVALLARAELRRRWLGLVVIGLVAGLAGGAALGAASVARRTATAYDRLAAATRIDDLRATVGDPELAERITSLPGVERSWVAGLVVGALEGEQRQYLAAVSGPERPPDLFRPLVVEGRAADPAAAEEVVVIEELADRLPVGSELRLSLLTPEEIGQFDTGFGDPDGPDVRLRVTGAVRMPSGSSPYPLLAGPAFAERYAASAAARVVFLGVEGGAVARVEEELEDLAATAPPVEGAEELPPVELDRATEARSSVAATASVLVSGLAAFAVVAVAVGLLTAGQALARHYAELAQAGSVEQALGLTLRDRSLGSLVPSALAAGVAGLVAGAIALAAGAIEPPGAVRRFEPAPGAAPNLALAGLGSLGVAVAVLALAAVLVRRSSRRVVGVPDRAVDGVPTGATALAAAGAPPVLATGVGFALPSRWRRKGTPVRSSLLGAVVGVLGIAAAVVFAGNLDELDAAPERYGWRADVAVIDTTPAAIGELAADERFDALALSRSSTVRLGGRQVEAYAVEPRRGDLGWAVQDGRVPLGGDEVTLGPRLAERLGAGVGDEVVLGPRRGGTRQVRVVGIGSARPSPGSRSARAPSSRVPACACSEPRSSSPRRSSVWRRASTGTACSTSSPAATKSSAGSRRPRSRTCSTWASSPRRSGPSSPSSPAWPWPTPSS